MVTIASLWMPILVATVLVFLASFVIHMVLPIHRNDLNKLPDEPGIMAALGKYSLPPGDYIMPHGGGREAMKDPAFIEKMKQGPIAFMTVMPSGPPRMGAQLALWFVYCLVIGVFAAYLTGRTVAAGASYMVVFRIAATVAFLGYAGALWQQAIWFRRNVTATLKSTIDGLVYGLLTGGAFGWLWPR